MRVQSRFLKTVVFVGTEAGGSFVPLGTGFLAFRTYRGENFNFIVTAEHVVDGASGDTISVRINRKSGDAATIKLEKQYRVSDPENDLAMFSLPNILGDFDYQLLVLDREQREYVASNISDISVGDEVATIGLYTSHYGFTKNIPVVRTGNIAMMPDEPVRGTKGDVVAYLVETRSIAGLSGSPVFLHFPPLRLDDKGAIFALGGTGPRIHPIGVMIGYHMVQSAEDQIAVGNPLQDEMQPPPSMDQRNTGFGIVTPFERVIEMAEHESVTSLMDAAIEERDQQK